MTLYTADITERYYGPPQSVLQTAFDLHGDASATPNEHQVLRFNLFYPKVSIAGPMPVGGWPVSLFSSLTGFTSGNKKTAIDTPQALQHELLRLGVAVAWANLPPARGGATDNPDGVADPTWDPENFPFRWGPPYRGNGCMVESTSNSGGLPVAWPGAFPAGYKAAFPNRPHPWLDPLWLNSSKGAMWLVQHMRYHGIEGAGPPDQKLDIHPGRIGAFGQSAAAISFAWPAYQPNRAGLTGDTSPQGQMSTRLNAGAFRQCTSFWLVFTNAAPPVGFMFHQKPSVSLDNEYDLPAAQMGDVDDSPFLTRGFDGCDWFGGFGGPGFGGDVGDPGIYLLNKAFKAWWSSDMAMDAAVLAISNRYQINVLDKDPGNHTMYQGYRVKARLPDNTTLVAENAGVVDPSPATGGGLPADKEIFTGVTDVYEDAAAFLHSNLELEVPVDEVVIRKMESVLADITFANGATTNVKAVYRFEDMPDDVPKAPCIMIDSMNISFDDRFEATVIRKTLAVDIVLFLEGWVDQMERLSNFMADVEKALYADNTLGSLIENLHIQQGKRHLLNPDMHEYAVAEMSVDIIFRHLIGDPFTPYPQ